ncbi:MAG TPA: helix-turn-helix transcriptional regulator [Pseudonocardiaceae bacterium]|nr:helix-turn-helix transcriptional regulator [Pseudonocardiaceae bacterium]
MAAVGQLLADRGRCRILLALTDGRALPASVLTAEAGVRPSTASGHLRKLTDRGLIEVLPTGRYRYYRLAGPDVARLVEVIGRLAPIQPVRSLREGTRAHALRLARRCYDHIGGRLGVAVTDALRERGLIEGPDGTPDLAALRGDRLAGGVVGEGDYRLTDKGHQELAMLGALLPPGLGAVRCCIDWTEQRHHVAGAVGKAVLDAFHSAGWITPAATHRALRVTARGVAGLHEHLGITWPPPSVSRTTAGGTDGQ